MSNNLSPQLLAELYGQVSDDPFLMLVTLSHTSFPTIYLVNNTEDKTSRGQVYQAFPMNIRLPADDGESSRQVSIDFDNVSLELIDELRSVIDLIDVKVEMVLASDLDTVQISLEDLKLGGITYNQSRISAKLFMDNFLDVALGEEIYTPTSYRGLF